MPLSFNKVCARPPPLRNSSFKYKSRGGVRRQEGDELAHRSWRVVTGHDIALEGPLSASSSQRKDADRRTSIGGGVTAAQKERTTLAPRSQRIARAHVPGTTFHHSVHSSTQRGGF